MKPVTIMIGPYGDEGYDTEHGYLVAPNHVMYESSDGSGNVWFLRVTPSEDPDVVIEDPTAGHKRIGKGQRANAVNFSKIVDKLTEMNGLEFMIRHIIGCGYEIEFDLLR